MKSISLWPLVVLFCFGIHQNTGDRSIPMRNYLYRNFLDVSTVNHFTAKFQGPVEVYVGLFDEEKIVYQIQVTADYYTVRECLNDTICTAPTYTANTTFNAVTFSSFWFRWEMNRVEFGTGLVLGLNRIGVHETNQTINVKYWAASGSNPSSYIDYHNSAQFVCLNGYKLTHPTKQSKEKPSRSSMDCAEACLKKSFCFAMNYRPDGYNNCDTYAKFGRLEDDDVIVPFNITVNSEWTYCHMSRR